MPRRTATTVSFDLPADLYAVAAQRAKTRTMTVDDYLRDRLCEALGRQKQRDDRPQGGKGSVAPRWKNSMKA